MILDRHLGTTESFRDLFVGLSAKQTGCDLLLSLGESPCRRSVSETALDNRLTDQTVNDDELIRVGARSDAKRGKRQN